MPAIGSTRVSKLNLEVSPNTNVKRCGNITDQMSVSDFPLNRLPLHKQKVQHTIVMCMLGSICFIIICNTLALGHTGCPGHVNGCYAVNPLITVDLRDIGTQYIIDLSTMDAYNVPAN